MEQMESSRPYRKLTGVICVWHQWTFFFSEQKYGLFRGLLTFIYLRLVNIYDKSR